MSKAARGPDAFFCHVPQLTAAESESIIMTKLNLKDSHGFSRTLTAEQKQVILDHVASTGSSFTPLYLSMATDTAIGWKSYTPLSECDLESSMRGIILQFFK